MSSFPSHSPPPLPGAPAPVLAVASPPAGRRWAWGELLAWAALVLTVTVVAWRASVAQYRMAAMAAPDMTLPMQAQYAVGVHELMLQVQPRDAARTAEELLSACEGMAKVPEDRLRVAILAGELLGADQAMTRLDALRAADPALAADVDTAKDLYRGFDVAKAARADFAAKYEWFAKLLESHGKPASDPARAEVVARAYLIVGVLLGMVVVMGMLLLAGIVLLIIAIVRLVQRKLKLAFSRADPTTGAARADRHTYIYAVAVYLGGYVGLSLLLRALLVRMQVDVSKLSLWVSILPLAVSFGVAVSLPLLRGQSVAQWRAALGLHTGRGVVREMLAGILGYITGAPLMAMGIGLVLVLSKISGLKGSHPIVNELRGPPLELLRAFLLVCVFAPVTEELMFRGALFAHLRERFGWWISAVTMGLIFALLHPQSWVALPALASIGIVFGGIREWRGSIIGSMTAHAMHNGMALVISILLLR